MTLADLSGVFFLKIHSGYNRMYGDCIYEKTVRTLDSITINYA